MGAYLAYIALTDPDQLEIPALLVIGCIILVALFGVTCYIAEMFKKEGKNEASNP